MGFRTYSLTFLSFLSLYATNVTAVDNQGNILWVIGNNRLPSMSAPRQILRDHAQDVIDALSSGSTGAATYQMAVTSTDFFTDQGQLKTNQSGVTFVATTGPHAASDFASLIDAVVDSSTSFWPQGLESSFQAVSANSAQLVQPNTPLYVVYVSDNEDFSCGDKRYGVQPMDNPTWVPFGETRYSNFFNQLKTGQNVNVTVFPIVGNNDSMLSDGCVLQNHGLRYQRVMVGTGSSTSYNVCKDAVLNSYLAVAKAIAN